MHNRMLQVPLSTRLSQKGSGITNYVQGNENIYRPVQRAKNVLRTNVPGPLSTKWI